VVTPTLGESAQLEAKLDALGTVLTELRQKLDNLAGILGEWIVGRGQPFYIEPGTTGYNPTAPTTGIKGEIEDLARQLDGLVVQFGEPDTALLELLPVEVTSTAGDRFRAFFELAGHAHVQAAEDLLAVNPEDEHMQEALRTTSQALLDVCAEFSEVIEVSRTLPLEMQAHADTVITEADMEILYEAASERPASMAPKFKVAIDTKATNTIKKVAGKAFEVIGSVNPLGIPVGKLIEVILRDIFDVEDRNSATMVAMGSMSLAQLELEKKLDALIRGLFGVAVFENLDETDLQAALRKVALGDFPNRFERLSEEIDELRQKLDNIGWWLGKLTTGSPIGVEPGSTNVMPQTNLWTLLSALEAKLDGLASLISDMWDDMLATLDDLEAKLDELAIGLRDVALLITDMWDDMGDRFNELNGAIASARRAITDAITAAETAIKTAITTTETAITTRIGTAETNITTRIGTAETNIRTDITTAETNINANITAAQTAIQADIAAAQGAILGGMGRNNQAILDNADLIRANTSAINGVLSQVNANGAFIQENSDDIQTLMNMVLNLQESNNRVEDKLNQQLGYPAAPDGSRMTFDGSNLVGEVGAVDPNSLVTVYWPTGDQPTVTAGPDGSFSLAVPPEAVGSGFAEVTQTDSVGRESARVIVYVSP
jgi:hypothetical protein